MASRGSAAALAALALLSLLLLAEAAGKARSKSPAGGKSTPPGKVGKAGKAGKAGATTRRPGVEPTPAARQAGAEQSPKQRRYDDGQWDPYRYDDGQNSPGRYDDGQWDPSRYDKGQEQQGGYGGSQQGGYGGSQQGGYGGSQQQGGYGGSQQQGGYGGSQQGGGQGGYGGSQGGYGGSQQGGSGGGMATGGSSGSQSNPAWGPAYGTVPSGQGGGARQGGGSGNRQQGGGYGGGQGGGQGGGGSGGRQQAGGYGNSLGGGDQDGGDKKGGPGGGDKKVVCYFTNWAMYRKGTGKYTPENIDASLCTHVVYGFAVLDAATSGIKPHDPNADIAQMGYHKVTSLRQSGVKVLLAVGGWADSAGDKYSKMVNDPAARARFVESAVNFLEEHKFDGLDLDWEYPKCWQGSCSSGPASDKEGFAAWVRELRAAFEPRGWLLSAAVSPNPNVIDQAYDVPTLAQNLDWIGIMAYDYHGAYDGKTGHHAPHYTLPDDKLNVLHTVAHYQAKGAPPHKLVMGVPTYGRSFTLSDPSQSGMGAPASAVGAPGEFTGEGGMLAFYEVCNSAKKGRVTHNEREGSFASAGNQWVSYDDVDDILRKMDSIMKQGLGGTMIWALDLDDFTGSCGCGNYPLLRAINQGLRGSPGLTGNCT